MPQQTCLHHLLAPEDKVSMGLSQRNYRKQSHINHQLLPHSLGTEWLNELKFLRGYASSVVSGTTAAPQRAAKQATIAASRASTALQRWNRGGCGVIRCSHAENICRRILSMECKRVGNYVHVRSRDGCGIIRRSHARYVCRKILVMECKWIVSYVMFTYGAGMVVELLGEVTLDTYVIIYGE